MNNIIRTMGWCLLHALTSAAIADQPDGVHTPIYDGDQNFHLAPRTALIIGVDSLAEGSGMTSLRNPRNDANAVAKVLRDAGFIVINLSETYESDQMTKQNIKKAIYDFARMLQKSGGVGLIYYSGHGVERGGKMYFFPYDSYIRFDRDFDEELISEAFLMDAFAFAGNPLNIVFLDACRDFPPSLTLPSFGATVVSEEVKASKNVVYAYSTLSGAKAADGIDTLSPYARAFVHAFNESDRGLNDFFSAIEEQLHLLHAEQDVANGRVPFGRDFVFVPTKTSFLREEDLFNKGRTTGNRDLINGLIRQYSAGYFYTAAIKLLNEAPLAPGEPVAPPTALAKVFNDSNARSQPTTASAVVAKIDAGSNLAVVGPSVRADGFNWLPVRVSPSSEDVAYLRKDRAQVVPTKTVVKTIKLEFEEGTNANYATLDAESLKKLHDALSDNRSAVFSTAVVGKPAVDSADQTGAALQLQRQAAAVVALHDLGVDTTRTGVSTSTGGILTSDNSVSVEVHSYEIH